MSPRLNQVLLLSCALLGSVQSLVILPKHEVLPQVTLESPLPATANQFHPTPLDDGDDDDADPLPVVIWHGLGDSADAEGLNSVADLIEEIYPGTYVHLVSLAEGSGDRTQSWFGDLNAQLDSVCQQLAEDPIISTAPAFDAVGFSQGGQFMRGYIERCGHMAPPVRSLLTFGSQHNGIEEFQKCSGFTDFLCNSANALLRSSLVWSDFIQKKVVPAQYYRPSGDLENYLEHSNFLADINNERELKNATYAENLAQLDKFVMILFEDDQAVIPKETGWFAEVDLESSKVTPLQNRTIYKEDWIGLKKLDEKGALVYETVKGEHMQLKDKDLIRLFKKYFGPVRKTYTEELKLEL